ncbi:MAG TPA: hypothetical protein VKT49_06505 [Bryobacteraceae bacterium]|nr:hypothetical protein [Bryobacteraceae bacterium]
MTLGRGLRISVLLAGMAGLAAAEEVKGVVMDQACSGKAEVRVLSTGIEGGMIVAEAHTRECAMMPACEKSGYGIFTYDNKFLKFDAAGSRKAAQAIKASKKLDDLEVVVTGEIKGDTIKVESLKLL